MGKSELFVNIEALAEEQVTEIQSASKLQSEQILEDARSKAQKLKEKAFLSGKELAERDRYTIEHRVSIEALQMIENAERELLHVLFASLAEKLVSLRSQPATYKKLLHDFVNEAVGKLQLLLPEESGFRVIADPRDKRLLENILNDFPCKISRDFSITTWGGVIVSNHKATVFIDNRLEQRLENATPILTREMLDRFELILAKDNDGGI